MEAATKQPQEQPPSFWIRFRIYIWISGTILLLILFFALGFASGMTKRAFEKKSYENRISTLENRIAAIDADRDRYQERLDKMRVDLEAASQKASEMEAAATTARQAAAQAQASMAAIAKQQAPTEPTTAEGGASSPTKAATGKAYLRSTNGNCALITSTNRASSILLRCEGQK